MTINKSQGQTIEYVGLDMTHPVFSHGQTYVAFSRVKGWNNIRVAVEPDKGNKVKNIVWNELLFDEDREKMPPPPTTPKMVGRKAMFTQSCMNITFKKNK